MQYRTSGPSVEELEELIDQVMEQEGEDELVDGEQDEEKEG